MDKPLVLIPYVDSSVVIHYILFIFLFLFLKEKKEEKKRKKDMKMYRVHMRIVSHISDKFK